MEGEEEEEEEEEEGPEGLEGVEGGGDLLSPVRLGLADIARHVILRI